MGSTKESKADTKENPENKIHCNCKISTGVLLLLTKEEQSAVVLQNYLIAVTEVIFFYKKQIQTKAKLNDAGNRKKKKRTEHLKKIKSCSYGSRFFTFPSISSICL